MKPLTPETIKRRLIEIAREEDREATVRLAADRAFAARVAAVRERCVHKWDRTSDPAGGPAYRWCTVCGVNYTVERDAAAKRLTISVTPTK